MGNSVNMLISPIARMKIEIPISISVKPDWDFSPPWCDPLCGLGQGFTILDLRFKCKKNKFQIPNPKS
jgi:hypothetical protein